MKRSWGVGLGLLMAVGLGGCATSTTGVDVDGVSGRWEWQSASGGIAGRTITPATEGYTMELRLLTGGKAQLYRSGTLTESADYGIGVGKPGGSFPGLDVIRFTPPSLLGSWDENRVTLTDDDHLTVANGCCDGFAYTFTRIGATP